MSYSLVFLLIIGDGVLGLSVRFTNIKCEVLDPSYAVFRKCDLKITGRGIVALNIYSKLLKGPFNNAKINLSFWRRYNGFRPFMFNKTIDFCKFVERSQKLSFEKIMMDIIMISSNMNHTCPYKDAIIVRDLVLKEEFFKFLPLPTGEYQLQIMPGTDNEWKSRVSVNIMIQEDEFKS